MSGVNEKDTESAENFWLESQDELQRLQGLEGISNASYAAQVFGVVRQRYASWVDSKRVPNAIHLVRLWEKGLPAKYIWTLITRLFANHPTPKNEN